MMKQKQYPSKDHVASGDMDDVFDRDLFRFLDAIVLHLDGRGNIVRLNPFAEKFFSADSGAVTGKPFVGTLAPPPSETVGSRNDFMERLLTNPKNSGEFICDVQLADGSLKRVAWGVSIRYDPHGSADEFTLIGTDRQMQRDRDRDLNRQFDLLEDFLEASNAAAYAVDSEHRFFYLTPGIRKVLGYSPEEMDRCHTGQFLVPEEKSRESGMVADQIRRKVQNCTLVIRGRHKSGGLVWTEITQNILYDEKGEFEGLIGLNWNVDQRKRTELALADQEQEFRFCLEHAQVLLTVTDEEGVIRNINRVGAQMYGKKPEEMIGHCFTEFLPDFERERVFQSFKKDFKTAISRKGRRVVGMGGIVNKIITPNGLKDLLFYKTGVKVYKEGRFEGILNTAVDITDIIKTKGELKRHRNHLEQLVVERTAELQGLQEEMVRRERLTALGKMAEVISQEIRSPLSTIGQCLFVIRERFRDSDIGVQRSIERADRAIHRCYSIVDEFKDFIQTDPLKKKSTHIDTWLHGLLNELSESQEGIVVRRFESGVSVDIDSNRLQRAIKNILENARYAVQGGNKGRIVVKSQLAFNRLEIEITDEGTGIPRQDLERIFEPLYSTKPFGLGLGLVVSRQIIEEHGGGISVESEEKKGTKILLWLPAETMTEGAES